MKNHPLFNSKQSWDLSGTDLSGCAPISNEKGHLSCINQSGTARLNGYMLNALKALVSGKKSEMALIRIGTGAYASEWKKPDGTSVIAYANAKGELNAAVVSATGKRFTPIPELGNPSDDFDTSSIIALYYLILLEDPGIEEKVRSAVQVDLGFLNDAQEKNASIIDDAAYRLCDLLQEAFEQGKLSCSIQNGSVDAITRSRVKSNALTGELICGKSEILMPGASLAAKNATVALSEAKSMFKEFADTQHWSDAEEQLIPVFSDDYIVPKDVLEIADWYVSSRAERNPANNFAMRACTGYGKSTSVKLLACILHKPLYIMTCHTGMETSDFLSTLVPATAPASRKGTKLPGLMDIWCDPEGAYEMITGEQKSDVDSEMAFNKLIEYVTANAGSESYFSRVESAFVKALKSGAICEIQEFSRIRDPGVLVGVNEFDHAGAIIPLIDGSIVTRHPEALTVWTDNIGYNSCRPVDPSVMRRMACVFDAFELDKKVIVDRALYNTLDALPRSTVEGMYDVWLAIREYCQKEEITEGDLSPSDLENWVSRTAKVGLDNALDTCQKCLISKTSTDRSTQETIKMAVVMPILDQKLKN